MVRSLLVLLLVLAAGVVEAAPRRRNRTYNTPHANVAPTATTRTESYMSFTPQSSAGTGSAQGVAEMMASRGVMQHFGGNPGYEGVGMAGSPEQALNACCYSNSGMQVVDQGVACGRNGKWYACKRYR